MRLVSRVIQNRSIKPARYPRTGCIPSKLLILPVLAEDPIVDHRFPESTVEDCRVTMDPFFFQHSRRPTQTPRACPHNETTQSLKSTHVRVSRCPMADRDVWRAAIYRVVADTIAVAPKALEKICTHALSMAGQMRAPYRIAKHCELCAPLAVSWCASCLFCYSAGALLTLLHRPRHQ